MWTKPKQLFTQLKYRKQRCTYVQDSMFLFVNMQCIQYDL